MATNGHDPKAAEDVRTQLAKITAERVVKRTPALVMKPEYQKRIEWGTGKTKA